MEAPRRIIARAPTRIDFGGGWTDVPPYCDREGGFVCNVAINRYATVSIERGSEDPGGALEELPLVTAALRRTGMADLRATVHNDFPVAAGLGGSSAASAALLAALERCRGRSIDRVAIAEEGRRIEVEELGVAGGRQDHYAATHGGALALTFGDGVSVQRLALTQSTRQELPLWSTLIYTGESRISGDTITAVLGAYESGVDRVVSALARMKSVAREMAVALASGDLHALGELLDEHWQHQRALHPTITTARIEEIVSRATRAGGIGAKAMGASGGGCVLVLSRPAVRPAVRTSLAGLGDVLDFGIDETGVTIVEERW
jgi:D-glycero-alpha-D-manno-heptose-7-phosphate kinase